MLASLVLVGSTELRRHRRSLGSLDRSDGCAAAADTGVDVRRREACERELAKTDPSLLGLDGLEARAGDDQVLVHADRKLRGRGQGPEGHQPPRDAQVAAEEREGVLALPGVRQGEGRGGSPAGIKRAVPSAKIGQLLTVAYGGIAARVPANKIGKLLSQPGVVAVQKDALNQPLDDNTSFLGATNVWPTLGGSSNAGSNVVIGMIDTGIWPEHPMIVDRGHPPPHPPAAYKGCAVRRRHGRRRISARRSRATTS